MANISSGRNIASGHNLQIVPWRNIASQQSLLPVKIFCPDIIFRFFHISSRRNIVLGDSLPWTNTDWLFSPYKSVLPFSAKHARRCSREPLQLLCPLTSLSLTRVFWQLQQSWKELGESMHWLLWMLWWAAQSGWTNPGCRGVNKHSNLVLEEWTDERLCPQTQNHCGGKSVSR